MVVEPCACTMHVGSGSRVVCVCLQFLGPSFGVKFRARFRSQVSDTQLLGVTEVALELGPETGLKIRAAEKAKIEVLMEVLSPSAMLRRGQIP